MRASLTKAFFARLYVDAEKIAERELHEPFDASLDAHREHVNARADALLGERATQNAGAFTDAGVNDHGRDNHTGTQPSTLWVSGWSSAAMVDLAWTYSNRQDLADLLRRTRRWVNEDPQGASQDPQPSRWATPTPAVPRRVVDRLGKDVVREMIEARAAGMKLREVAERYGISESSVKRMTRMPTELKGGLTS